MTSPRTSHGEQPTVSVPQARTAPETESRTAPSATGDTGWRTLAPDPLHWGPIWAGTLITFTTNVVLQLLFYSLGWLDLGSGSSMTATVVSGVLGLVAFLLGGLAVGASARWARAGDSVLHGLIGWALTVTLLFSFGLAGAGAWLGTFTSVVGGFGTVTGSAVTAVPRPEAGWAVIGLVLAAIVTVFGATVSARWRKPVAGDRQR